MTARSTSEGKERRERDAPVRIVGAGPSGIVCAIVLAKAGRDVVVHEARADVGARFHGDFQGLENWSNDDDVIDELEAAGIEAGFGHHPITRVEVFDDLGRCHEARSPRPLYYLVRRGRAEGTLDRDLLRQAQDAGVVIRFGDRVRHVDGTAVLGGGPRRADAIAVGYVFETEMADGNWLVVDDRLAPRGYSYLLVHNGRGTVASCLFTDFKRQASYLEATLAFFRDRAGLRMLGQRPFGGYANFRIPRTAVQGGHPVLGEHAGFQDALAGFGMRYALRSGLLAARSVLDGTDYAELWRRQLLPSLQAGTVNRWIANLMGPRGRRYAVGRLCGDNSRLALQWVYRGSTLSRLVFPLARHANLRALQDPSCDHVGCSCVWCACGQEDEPPH